jgi:hypothetical protein
MPSGRPCGLTTAPSISRYHSNPVSTKRRPLTTKSPRDDFPWALSVETKTARGLPPLPELKPMLVFAASWRQRSAGLHRGRQPKGNPRQVGFHHVSSHRRHGNEKCPKAIHKVVERWPDRHASATPTRGAACPHDIGPELADSLSGASNRVERRKSPAIPGRHAQRDRARTTRPGKKASSGLALPRPCCPILFSGLADALLGRCPTSATTARVKSCPCSDREGG